MTDDHDRWSQFLSTPLDAVAADVVHESWVGRRWGSYEIVAPLGAGGMGEVYRARDTRLGRDVAVKVLPASFVADRERLARFEREARVLAALNHPHIAAIHGIEDVDGASVLVLELVAGETLGDRIARGPIPWRDAEPIVRQITEALEAAHEKGIIHRDLKPSNIALTPSGTVKVLDFGLAKVADGPATDLSQSPTITVTVARDGVLLGTPAYMSPEQARGRPVDKRTDIWAFGCVLYEMLTGRMAFTGNTAADHIAAILDREPDWSALPVKVPPQLQHVLRGCLEKDVRIRWRDIADIRLQLDRPELRLIRDPLSESTVTPLSGGRTAKPSSRARLLMTTAASALVIGFAGAAVWPIRIPDPSEFIPFATDSDLQVMPRWSPGGDRIAYVASVDGVLQVFTKTLDSSVPTQLTHEEQSCLNPMWSADGSHVYYLTGIRPNGTVRAVAVAGGSSEIVLAGVYRAELSPDGKTMAVLVRDKPGEYRLAFSSPPGSPPQPYSHPLLADFRDTGPMTVMQFDRSGRHLGLATNARARDEFWEIPLDGSAPRPLTPSVGIMRFAFTNRSREIVVDTADATTTFRHLTLVDLTSRLQRVITAGSNREMTPSVSPDGTTLAFASGTLDFDVIEVPLDGSRVRNVIATSRAEFAPSWAPDGTRFAYITDRTGVEEIWLRNRADLSERLIVSAKRFPTGSVLYDCAVSPDGSRIAYRVQGAGRAAIWISPISGDLPVPLWDDPLRSPQRGPSWSPDGNWIAYYGVDNGKFAVMKARVGATAVAERLAGMARLQPVRWSPRGDWIAFRDGDTLKVVSPDGKRSQVISQRIWETYGWNGQGDALYGIGWGDNRRLSLARIDLQTLKESQIADLGPVPPAFEFIDLVLSDLPFRGFSLHPDGRSILTSVQRTRAEIYLLKDFDRTVRLADRWFK